MTDVAALTLLIGTTVANDAAVKAWAQANYTRNHEVYIGVDIRKPPDPEIKYPAVNVYPDTKSVGYDLPKKRHEIGVSVGINNDGTTPVGGVDNLTQATGFVHLEAFRKLVEDAIFGIWVVGTDEMEAGSMSIQYDVIDRFPNFFADMSWVLNEQYFQGTAIME